MLQTAPSFLYAYRRKSWKPTFLIPRGYVDILSERADTLFEKPC